MCEGGGLLGGTDIVHSFGLIDGKEWKLMWWCKRASLFFPIIWFCKNTIGKRAHVLLREAAQKDGKSSLAEKVDSVTISLELHFRMVPRHLEDWVVHVEDAGEDEAHPVEASLPAVSVHLVAKDELDKVGWWRKVTSVKIIVIAKSTRLKARAKKSLQWREMWFK